MTNQQLFKNNIAFWIFTLAVAIGLTLPFLIQEGMFMDGVLYSCVSRNLGHGIGSFWFPQFSELNVGGLPSFHEQPPLVFGIQSVFFYLFGNSIYIERVYTLLALMLTIYLINLIWKGINNDHKNQIPFGWLSVFLWISIALSFWTFRHNMQENTMGVFTLLSVLFCIKAINKPDRQFLYISLSGFFVSFALFSKGFPGLFPVAVPFLLWLILRKPDFLRMIQWSALMLLIPLAIIGILLIFPDSRQSLHYYFFDRFLHRIDYMPTIGNRFYSIYRLLMELIAPVAIVIVLGIVLYLLKAKVVSSRNAKLSLLFALIGFTGVAPLCLTLVQKGFYFTPSLPYFGIALALLVSNGLEDAFRRIKNTSKGIKIFKYLSIGLLIAVIILTITRFGTYQRHHEMIEDVKTFAEIIPENTCVTIPEDMWYEYDFIFQGYLMRYAYVSINPFKNYKYFICEKGYSCPFKGYIKVNIDTQMYDLYRKI